MNWFEGGVHCRSQEPKHTHTYDWTNKSFLQYHILHPAGEGPIKSPSTPVACSRLHHYKRYMGTAFDFTTTYLWRSGLIPYRPFPFGTVMFVVHIKGVCDFSTNFCSAWIIWIAAHLDCSRDLQVHPEGCYQTEQSQDCAACYCYCYPKRGNQVWKQLPRAANWIFPDEPRNVPPCFSNEHSLVNKCPYIGLCGQS